MTSGREAARALNLRLDRMGLSPMSTKDLSKRARVAQCMGWDDLAGMLRGTPGGRA